MIVFIVLFTLYTLFIFICRHFNLSSRTNLQYYSYSKEINTSEFAEHSNNLIMNETLCTVFNIKYCFIVILNKVLFEGIPNNM